MPPATLRPTAQPFVPGQTQVDIMQEYFELLELCCSALEPEREDEDFASFLEGCKQRVRRYPTLNDLRGLIATKPMKSHFTQDFNPHLDLAVR